MWSVSFIVVGRNSSATLAQCLDAISLLRTEPCVKALELIYVDSRSTDDSVRIAETHGATVIKIVEGPTTAAAGRHLGMRVAQHDILIFCDSDMVVARTGVLDILSKLTAREALVGEREEHLFDPLTQRSRLLTTAFYKFLPNTPVPRFGGFLAIKKRALGGASYNPFLESEEEADFYAQIRSHTKVYAATSIAYAHLNVKRRRDVLKAYLRPAFRSSYLLSILRSARAGYFAQLLVIQRMYFLSLCMVLFLALALAWPLSGLGALACLFASGRRARSCAVTAAVFPLKVLHVGYSLLKGKQTIRAVGAGYSFVIEGSALAFQTRQDTCR